MITEKKPKITVVIPVYNAEKYLRRSIGSIVNQTYNNIEIILVNDGSRDKSKDICEQYASSNYTIKVITQENKGPAGARNTGIRYAQGDFIFFLDADDFIEKETLEKLISIYHKYQPELVMSNFNKLELGGKLIRQNVYFSPEAEKFDGLIRVLSKKDLVSYIRHFLKYPSNHLISYCWARLYKLSIIRDHGLLFDENMRLFEDFVFNLHYFKYINNIVFLNEHLYTYTMPKNQITASMNIIRGDTLVHDMEIFKRETINFFQEFDIKEIQTFVPKREIGHALIHYTIIFLVRSCRYVNRNNKKIIYSEIVKIVNAPIVQRNLLYYSPLKGMSKIVPKLIKLRLISLLISICKYKAHRRYGCPLSVKF